MLYKPYHYQSAGRNSRASLVAEVLQSLPRFGIAIVLPLDDQASVGTARIARLPYQKTPAGVGVYQALPERTMVSCMLGNHDDLIITGPCNVDVTARDDSADENGSKSPVFETLTRAEQKAAGKLIDDADKRLRDFSAGASSDLLPGDMDLLDKNTGVGLSLRRSLARLVGDAMSLVETGDDGRTRLSGTSIVADTPLNNIEIGQDYITKGMAATLSEAFGVTAQPMKKQALTDDEKKSGKYTGKDRLALSDEDALPLYRIQEASGAAIDGMERVVVGFPDGDRHTSDTQPPVLARLRTSLLGDCSIASAGRISSVKTMRIPAVSRLGYNGKSALSEDGKFNDLQERWMGEVPLQTFDEVPEEDRIRDAALHELAERLLADDYVDALAEKLQERGFSLFKVDDKEKAKLSVDVNAAVIKPPQPEKVTDPVTGKEHERYDTTSFITHEPDGSICICDGYGSEIRMSQGNIYISPALDLFLRPGRDISVMAGRHQAYNSQGSLTLNTSDAMYARAEHRMSFCAGTSDIPGEDGIILESCNNAADVVIRSAGNLSVTGERNILLGRRIGARAGEQTAGGQELGAGTLVVDAGKSGNVYMNCGMALTAEAGTVDVCSINASGNGGAGAGAALRMSPNNIDLVASLVQAPAQMLLRAPDGSASIKLPRNGGLETVKLHTAARGAESLVVGGQLIVDKGAKFNSQVQVAGSLAAIGIANTSMYCGKMRDSDRRKVSEKAQLPSPAGLADRPAAGAGAVSALQRPGAMLADKYLDAWLFAFPDDYGVDASLVVPGMVWQENAAGDTWEERPVRRADGTETMAYPGANIWNGCSISGLIGKAPLSAGYRTNANHGGK